MREIKLIFDLTEPWDDLNMRRSRIESDYEIERWFLSWNVPATEQMKKGIFMKSHLIVEVTSKLEVNFIFGLDTIHESFMWLKPASYQPEYIQLLSQYFGQLFFWSRNVFDMAVDTKKGSLQHPIFNKGLMFCNYVIRNVIGSKHLLFKLT